MKIETFFEKFEQFADAPHALRSIRRFILDSAVRGDLVAQNPKDEPASKLMARIQREREHLEKKGELKKGAPLAPLDVKPYDLPMGWEWTRLGHTGRIFNGNSVNESGKVVLSKVTEGFPFIATKDVGYGRDRFAYENGLKVPFDAPNYKVAKAEAIFICAEGGSAGRKMGQAERAVCFGNKLYANEVWPGIEPRFILSVYQTTAFFKEFTARMTGIIGGIARSEFLLLPVPIAPENEQKRIVAKVDELMALCDRLEAQQQERDKQHAALARASLIRFADAPTPANLDFLFHKSYAITPADLRKSILTLAVQGKLVPQTLDDQPVDDLLARTLIERLKHGRATAKAVNKIDVDQALGYDIPDSWRWQTLDDILVSGPTNGFSPKAVDYETPVRSLTLSATTSGRFKGEHSKFITTKVPADADLWLRDGEILVQRGNTIEYVGVAAVYRGQPNQFVYPDLMMKLRVASSFDVGFIHLAMSQESARDFLRARASGTSGTMPKINQATLKSLPLPIPPLSEQRRIVAKVDQLMAMVDQLETQLAESRATATRLMEAVVAELIANRSHNTSAKAVSLADNIVPLAGKAKPNSNHKPPDEFVEAVAIAQLTRALATPKYPLGRLRYTKLAYLAHRKADDDVTQRYLKKAAGPYSPWARYGGPETIALEKGYVDKVRSGSYEGLIAGDHIDEIDSYVSSFPLCSAVDWVIRQLRFKKNDELELLATVDFAAFDVHARSEAINLQSIKHVIATNLEWLPKLERAIFADKNIKRALAELAVLFPAFYR